MEVRYLEIEFKTNKLKKQCTVYSISVKEYGKNRADKIAQRMNELQASDSVDELIQYSIGRCHALKGNREGEFAMDLVHPYRLIFEKCNHIVELIRITSIEDYH
ncbi:hypothetical protein FACS1894111_06230 [Clostridia bacterium]|nr:hypothetical protein FACS1894111_06230 [Clostridia bacterium]